MRKESIQSRSNNTDTGFLPSELDLLNLIRNQSCNLIADMIENGLDHCSDIRISERSKAGQAYLRPHFDGIILNPQLRTILDTTKIHIERICRLRIKIMLDPLKIVEHTRLRTIFELVPLLEPNINSHPFLECSVDECRSTQTAYVRKVSRLPLFEGLG